MTSTSEVGHAKNVANFQDLIAFVEAYGATYNPTKNSLKLPQLHTLLAESQNSLQNVVEKHTTYNNVINARVTAFDGIRLLATRLISALETTNASKETINDAKGFNRKMRGQRASKKKTSDDPNQPAPKTISASQQSYDQLIQHFEGLIAVLQSEPSYAPNEEDLKIASLHAKVTQLKTNNNNVSVAYASVSNARIERDKVLNNPDTGLVDIASEIKKYIKSVFGPTSEQFAQVKGIQFKKITNK